MAKMRGFYCEDTDKKEQRMRGLRVFAEVTGKKELQRRDSNPHFSVVPNRTQETCLMKEDTDKKEFIYERKDHFGNIRIKRSSLKDFERHR